MEDCRAAAMERIGRFEEGDVTALPWLYGCFAGSDEELIAYAARVLAGYLETLRGVQVARFGDRMREYTSMEWYEDWRNVVPSRLRPLLSEREWFAVLAAGSFHPNGYYRERCLRAMRGFGGRALPYLFLRLNDWVRPVRELALDAALEAIAACPMGELLDSLGFLYRAGRGERRPQGDYDALLGLVRERFAAGGETDFARIARLDRDARRICHRFLLEAGRLTEQGCIALLKREKDPFIRLLAARRMLEGPCSGVTLERALLSHRDYRLRLLALQWRYDAQGPDWPGFMDFLADRSQAVRELARYAVRERDPSFDFAAGYRRRLGGPDSEGALLGLSETGTAEDAALARPFLQASEPRLLKAALLALGRLCAREEAETFYRFLLQGEGGAAKTAFRAIQNNRLQFGCARYYEDLLASPSPVVRRRLCALIGQGGRWESLAYLILLAGHPDAETAEWARGALSAWHGGFLKPNRAQRELAERALEEQRPALPEQVVRGITFALEHCR